MSCEQRLFHKCYTIFSKKPSKSICEVFIDAIQKVEVAMTVSTILIHPTFPFDKRTSCFVIVDPKSTISQITESAIQIMYPSLSLNPEKYGIFILPEKKWLYPECSLVDYSDYLMKNEVSEFQLRPRNIISITVTCLHFKTLISCDPNLPISMLPKQVTIILRQHKSSGDFFDWDEWSVWENGIEIDKNQLCATVANHTLHLRRENKINQNDDSQKIGYYSVFKAPLKLLEKQNQETGVPLLIEMLFQKIEENPQVEGVFRKSGSQITIDDFIAQINQKIDSPLNQSSSIQSVKDNFKNMINKLQTHDATSLIKSFLRNLPEPIISSDIYSQLVQTLSISTLEDRLPFYKCILDSMPNENFAVLRRLSKCFNIITKHSEENKMSMMNIAICLMPALVRNKPETDQMLILSQTKTMNSIGCDIFNYSKYLFESQSITLPSRYAKCIHEYPNLQINKVYSIIEDNSKSIKGQGAQIHSASNSPNNSPKDFSHEEFDSSHNNTNKVTVKVDGRIIVVPENCLQREDDIVINDFSNWAFSNKHIDNEMEYLAISSEKTGIGVNSSIKSKRKSLSHKKNSLKKMISELNYMLSELEKGNESNLKKEEIFEKINQITQFSLDIF